MQSNINSNIYHEVSMMLNENRHDIYVHDIAGQDIEVTDTDVIICYYGTDAARLDSTKKAFELFKKYKAKAHEVLVIESQYDENEAQLKDMSVSSGFSYKFVKRHEDSDGLYIREALMNIGVHATTAPKIVFLDSDIGFCNPYWLESVSLALDKCDMTQPFGSVYFVKNGSYELQRNAIEPSMTKCYVQKNDHRLALNTGLGFAFKRWVIDAIGGFDVISSPSDDLWLWSKFLHVDETRIPQLPYSWAVDGFINKQCSSAKLGICNEMCFHIEHSDSKERRYSAYVYACSCQSAFPLWDVDYDKREDVMPKWKDDGIWTQIRKNTVKRIQNYDYTGIDDPVEAKKIAKDAIAAENLRAFGEIPQGKKLKIITLASNQLQAKDIMLHRQKVIECFGNKVEYICISNNAIPGIRTVPFSVKNKNMRLIDIFRKDVSGDKDICLYMSLGAIPIEKTRLCNIPAGFIGICNPRCSPATISKWHVFDNQVLLFSGDFSFIYDNYAKCGKFDQSKMFMTESQCIAWNLEQHGIQTRNICQFIDVQTIFFNQYSTYEDYANNIGDWSRQNKFRLASIAVGHMFGKRRFG